MLGRRRRRLRCFAQVNDATHTCFWNVITERERKRGNWRPALDYRLTYTCMYEHLYMCVSMHVSLCGCVHIWMLLRPIHYIFMPFLVLALPHYNQTYVNTHRGGLACMYTCVFIHTTCINIPTTNINTIWECRRRRRRRCRRYRFSCCRSSESNFYSYYMYGSNINNTHSHTHCTLAHTVCPHGYALPANHCCAPALCSCLFVYIEQHKRTKRCSYAKRQWVHTTTTTALTAYTVRHTSLHTSLPPTWLALYVRIAVHTYVRMYVHLYIFS